MAAALIGFLRGNEFKLILQDARALSYYVLFFVVILLVNDRRLVLAFLRLLAFCVPVVFAIGAVYAALGQGMKLEYVEPGVSRFPAPDDVFLMSSVMTLTFFTVWPPGRPRPRWLWGLLLLSLLGLVLSLVRGNWVAFAVAVLYLLLVLRVRERVRLIALGVVLTVLLAGVLAVAQPALLRSVVSRAMAVTAIQDRNVQWRLIENRAVGAQIEESPWVGNGLGKDYLFDWSRYGVAPYRKSYIHNDYYWFVHRLGVVGMVAVRVAGGRVPGPVDEGQGDLAQGRPLAARSGVRRTRDARRAAGRLDHVAAAQREALRDRTRAGDGPLRGRAFAAQAAGRGGRGGDRDAGRQRSGQ